MSIEVNLFALGMRPYILIEYKLGPDGEDDLRFELNAGGGIANNDEVKRAMILALMELCAKGGHGEPCVCPDDEGNEGDL